MSDKTHEELATEIKARLKAEGMNMADFAEKHGYRYRDVSDVMRGVRRGYYGKGREIARKLGFPVQD